MITRPTRQAWLFGIAAAVAEMADCSRRQVGALVVDPETWHVHGLGYNGRLSGLPGCATAGACPRGHQTQEQVASRSSYTEGAGSCDAVHAEDNALRRALDAGADVRGMMVVVTYEPCPGCYALLRHYGIVKVVWPGGERDL